MKMLFKRKDPSVSLRKLAKQNHRILKKIDDLEFLVQSLVNLQLIYQLSDWNLFTGKVVNSAELDLYNFRYLSQHGEDGVILKILKHLNLRQGVVYEIGAGDNGGNTGILSLIQGFRCNYIETDRDACIQLQERFRTANVQIINEYVTAENINDLVSEKPTILSIDIDSFDYWVLEKLQNWPIILIVEYNASFGLKDLVVSKDYDFSADKYPKTFQIYGASLTALSRLASSKGYELIYCEKSGTNAFFIHSSYSNRFQVLNAEKAYRSSNRSRLFNNRKIDVESAIKSGDLISFERS